MRPLPKKNFFLLVLSASLLIVGVTTVGLVNSNPTVASSSAKTDRYYVVPFGPKGTTDAS